MHQIARDAVGDQAVVADIKDDGDDIFLISFLFLAATTADESKRGTHDAQQCRLGVVSYCFRRPITGSDRLASENHSGHTHSIQITLYVSACQCGQGDCNLAFGLC
jgi:hypothetical protein